MQKKIRFQRSKQLAKLKYASNNQNSWQNNCDKITENFTKDVLLKLPNAYPDVNPKTKTKYFFKKRTLDLG